jgi:hypothetical protein
MLMVLGLLLGLIAFMLLYLVRRAAIERRNSRWRTVFSDVIQRALDWESEDQTPIPITFRAARCLRRKAARAVLTDQLMSGKKALSGSAGANLIRLYTQFGLEADSLRKLSDPAWHRKAQGVQELALMEQRRQVRRIYRLTNTRNDIVRMEAQAAIVQLYGFDGLRFLDVIVQPISEWQQIHLLRLLSKTQGSPSEKLADWLKSENGTVRSFARKLIAEHHLDELFEVDELNDN